MRLDSRRSHFDYCVHPPRFTGLSHDDPTETLNLGSTFGISFAFPTEYAESSWESEEIDKPPHARFLTAGREALRSCEVGDTMETRPEQFR